MKLHPYLNYGGNCAEAFRFYEEHLGGKITFMMTNSQMPNPQGALPGPPDAIMYASIELGGTRVMGNDVPPERFQPMRSFYLCLSTENDAEAEHVYNLLAEGGEIFMPIQETFFATRFGMLRDRFGASWMIIHERPMPAA